MRSAFFIVTALIALYAETRTDFYEIVFVQKHQSSFNLVWRVFFKNSNYLFHWHSSGFCNIVNDLRWDLSFFDYIPVTARGFVEMITRTESCWLKKCAVIQHF